LSKLHGLGSDAEMQAKKHLIHCRITPERQSWRHRNDVVVVHDAAAADWLVTCRR